MIISNLIGNTPLVKLGDKLYAKFEAYNPSGSIKDRMAAYILQKAEENGDLRKDRKSTRLNSSHSSVSRMPSSA